MSNWKPATNARGEPESCPTCKAQTEHEIGKDDEENETLEAERCQPCGWLIRFTDEGPVRVR